MAKQAMNSRRYIGIVDGSGDVWGAVLPDFPGCYGGGSTPEQAVVDITSALREFATDMRNCNEELPNPSSFEEIGERVADGEFLDGVRVYVPLLIEDRRPVKANITTDRALLTQIDVAAAERGMTRSKFLVTTAIDRIARGD